MVLAVKEKERIAEDLLLLAILRKLTISLTAGSYTDNMVDWDYPRLGLFLPFRCFFLLNGRLTELSIPSSLFVLLCEEL